jgi:colanic acid/amylovoran biosynthesis glycosyltransferase
MMTLFHSNAASVVGGMLRVDRKFLTGMQRYANLIHTPLVTVHPEMDINDQTMDVVEVRYEDVGFEVMTISPSEAPRITQERLSAQIGRSELIYGYTNWGAVDIAKRLGVPYILILEYDLRTQISVSINQVQSNLRRAVRTMRTTKRYISIDIPAMRGAKALHCNGYPIYDESRHFNANRILYLDSRMSEDMVISAEQLNRRLKERKNRPVRLLFSGRYELIKGADECVRVAVECLRAGLDIELHCYGQGSLRETMQKLAQQAPVANRIFIHDAIPYPELVQRSYEFDIFVCCHIQNDPSCTYLESFGAALPVVGYANRMWKSLNAASKVGFATPVRQPEAVVKSIATLIADEETMRAMSIKAREFAANHTFEREFAYRTNAINEELARNSAH